MRRLPITIRLTLVFAAVMAAVLAVTGLFLYVRLGAELDRVVGDDAVGGEQAAEEVLLGG